MIARAEQELRAEIDRARLIRTQSDRRIPVKAKVRVTRPWQWLDLLRFARGLAEARDLAALVFGIGVIGIGGSRSPETVADTDLSPRRLGIPSIPPDGPIHVPLSCNPP